MPITELLEKKAKQYPEDIALVEINRRKPVKIGGNLN